ncbi:hypothetical protein F383_19614 [Gossypium arboreum]|uniref:Uncharacterized protein n=1 Tax=Gossypium arboreum TaxID=29729 RepID=A0A0B0NTX5_GOSAR|nr:hypothetical protein F383_19614 [Gossypium arboreum]
MVTLVTCHSIPQILIVQTGLGNHQIILIRHLNFK